MPRRNAKVRKANNERASRREKKLARRDGSRRDPRVVTMEKLPQERPY